MFEPLQKLIINILYIIDEHFYIPFVLSDFPPAMMFIYYLTFSLSIIFIQRNKLQRAFKYSLLFISLLILMALRPFFSPEGVITMLDIGQGEAIVVELPYRRGVFLIDAGASVSFEDYEVTDDVYEQTIKPFLYSRGIQTVDALLLSHGHIDHNGSSQYIIEDFNTSLVVVSEFYEPRDDEHKLWQEKNVQTVRLTGGDLFTLKGQPFRVISPMTDTFDIDDNSLVLQSTFGGKTWLFTGDISQSVERKIKATYPELTIDVLKVAHHGSRTSSAAEFIEHIRPDYALISVGQNNAYNHPHDEVIATLAEANATILRTDYYGAIQYIFTKEDGTFFTFLP